MPFEFDIIQSVYINDNLEHLIDSIQSVLNNTILPKNYIIVADGRISDEIDNYLKDLINTHQLNPKFIVTRLQDNQGLACAMNCAIELTNSDLVARMDSDDVCLPTRFENQLFEFENKTSLSLCGMFYDQYDYEMKIKVGTRSVPTTDKQVKETIFLKNPINHPTLMMRRRDLLNIGGYDTDCLFFEDWMLVFKFWKSDLKIKNIPFVGLKVRGGLDFYKRRKGYEYWRHEIKFFKKLFHKNYIKRHTLLFNIGLRFVLRVILGRYISYFYNFFVRQK